LASSDSKDNKDDKDVKDSKEARDPRKKLPRVAAKSASTKRPGRSTSIEVDTDADPQSLPDSSLDSATPSSAQPDSSNSSTTDTRLGASQTVNTQYPSPPESPQVSNPNGNSSPNLSSTPAPGGAPSGQNPRHSNPQGQGRHQNQSFRHGHRQHPASGGGQGSVPAQGSEASEAQAPRERPKPVVERLHLRELKQIEIEKVVDLGLKYNIENASGLRRQDLIFSLLQAHAAAGGEIYTEGTLEILQDGFGFLRSADYNYLSGPDDIYVSPSQVRKWHLRTGDHIAGTVRPPNHGERYFALLKLDTVNFEDPSVARDKILFENLIPYHPTERIHLEYDPKNLTTRIIDLFAPIGKGQRALVVAPPKAGKTVMLKDIAHGITTCHPEVKLIVLLIDERPEEVTDMKRSVKGEVVSSTFDEPPSRHVQVAEMVIEKAKRLVEHKHHVVILLDSITRLGRAYNTVAPPSGKILSGGVDSNALHKPKRFFGAARNIEGAGSLTIIATALIDTGSRMDEVIFEEFKGTGNMEIVLDRKLMEQRVFPCIDINKSGTRREDLLLRPDVLQRLWILRKILQPMSTMESAKFVVEHIGKSKTNDEFISSMNG
jgi:transcription termination factor Rho